MPVRCLVVDDHPVFRDGLRAMINAAADLELVGEAATSREVFDAVTAGAPDVILMDVNLAGESGIEVTRQLIANWPGVAILMLTMLDDDASVFAAMRAGARGYLVKGASAHEIVHAIRAVAAGEAVFGAALARRILAMFAAPRAAGVLPFPDLTDREHQILELIARGLSNQAIAARVGITAKTVRNNVSLILNKLEVVDRSAAIVRARQAGLGDDRAL